MNGNNKGETIQIKRLGSNWYQKHKYYQTRFNRIKKDEAINAIRQAFDEGKNMEVFGHISFKSEMAKMVEKKNYYFEYWDDKPILR